MPIVSKRYRRHYEDVFKQNAVRTLLESGKPVTTVAEQLGIEQSNLHKWNKRYGEEIKRTLCDTTTGYYPDELRTLRAEIASLQDTVETLRQIVLKLLNQKYKD